MDSYHFIGIKGSGMSALAQILYDMGNHVQGEDVESHFFTQTPLESRSIAIYTFGSAPLSPNMKVIASNAYSADHPALIRCRKEGLQIYQYHHFLGEWMKSYTSIAVTGSHGKTTTTGMMAHAFRTIEPTCSLIGDGTGIGTPNARLFVFESCEYRRHFLAYRPDIAVITNIDFDHPDYFADIHDVRQAFEEMASFTSRQLVVCGDDPHIRMMQTSATLLYYGFDAENLLRASDLTVENNGLGFNVHYKDTLISRFTIPVFGKHNVLNALAVIGVAMILDLDLELIKDRMATFSGVKRRFTERMWQSNIVIDDYAHHPAEISATLDAARSKYPHKKLVGIFQPHTYSRLEKLLEDFALSLKQFDDVFLCPIFGSARESKGNISIEHLQALIRNAKLLSNNSSSELSAYKDSVLVFMGAGDIQKYQDKLLES